MTHPYKDAVQALTALVISRMRGEHPPSSLGGQIDRLVMGNPDRPTLNVCPECATETKQERCPTCRKLLHGQRPVQSRHNEGRVTREQMVIGDLAMAWTCMSRALHRIGCTCWKCEEDRRLLELWVRVPAYVERAKRCRNKHCRQIVVGEDGPDGLVYPAACPACSCRRFESIPGKAQTIARQLTWERKQSFGRRRKRVYANEIGPRILGLLNRWTRELKDRGLIP